jgi:hypothetical protein
MLQKIIRRILLGRHYWRHVGFDELSEIYASMFLRSFALSLIAIFVPVYLYKIGYSVQSILLMYVVWFASRMFFSALVTRVINSIGPKHCIAFGTVLHIAYLSMLMTIQDLHWPLLLTAVLGSLANSAFVLAFEVDFSKVKHTEHGGKELGYVQTFERIGAVLGPLAGGIIANFTDPRYTITLAIIMLCGSLIPIFMSSEPTHTHKKMYIAGFPFKRHLRDFISASALGVENTISLIIWPLFISIYFFTTNTFAKLGLVTSLGTAVALLAIYSIGRLVDDQRGRLLLNVGAISNAIVHIFRPFVTGLGQIIGLSIINEPVTAAYRIPYLKGRFDAADQVVGYRAVYFMINDIFNNFANTIIWSVLFILSLTVSELHALQFSFIIAVFASLLIMTQKFSSLR